MKSIEHSKFQKDFFRTLLGEKEERSWERDLVACGTLSVKEAFGIYKNNYFQNLKKSLAQTFECSQKVLTEGVFEQIAYAYIRKKPLLAPNIASYGKDFPSFMGLDLVKRFPFLPELSCLEWHIKELFAEPHRQRCITSMEELCDDAYLRVVGARAMKVSHPVHEIWLDLLYGKKKETFLKEPCALAIARREEKVYFHLFPLGLLSTFQTLRKGLLVSSLMEVENRERKSLAQVLSFLINSYCVYQTTSAKDFPVAIKNNRC